MLCNLLDELGLTESQFASVCMQANENKMHRKLVSEITAVDNFTAFKKLMVRKNRELNLEAMNVMAASNIQPIDVNEQEAMTRAIADSLGQTPEEVQ